MEEKRTLRILFIGNSHTYFNDMPAMVAEKARKAGFDCEVTMIAHGGWYLEQHVQEPDVRFNILYGHYDYVVLQEFSHPFGPEEKFFGAVRTLDQWIREATIGLKIIRRTRGSIGRIEYQTGPAPSNAFATSS